MSRVENTVNSKLAVASKDMEVLRASLEGKERELTEATQKMFSQLSEQQQRDFKEKFLALLAENGATKEQLRDATSKSPGELLALTGGGGGLGVIALMALLRTFGKSRSQDEINELYDKVGELEKRGTVNPKA